MNGAVVQLHCVGRSLLRAAQRRAVAAALTAAGEGLGSESIVFGGSNYLDVEAAGAHQRGGRTRLGVRPARVHESVMQNQRS